MTDDEIEKLLLDNGFNEKQLNYMRKEKKEYSIDYFTQLQELKKIFLGIKYISIFLFFIFVLLIFFSKKDAFSLTISFAIGFTILYIVSPVSLSRNAFKFLKKGYFSNES